MAWFPRTATVGCRQHHWRGIQEGGAEFYSQFPTSTHRHRQRSYLPSFVTNLLFINCDLLHRQVTVIAGFYIFFPSWSEGPTSQTPYKIVDYGNSDLQPLVSEKWNWSNPLGILNQIQKLVLSKQEVVINVTHPGYVVTLKISRYGGVFSKRHVTSFWTQT